MALVCKCIDHIQLACRPQHSPVKGDVKSCLLQGSKQFTGPRRTVAYSLVIFLTPYCGRLAKRQMQVLRRCN
jgi:hypothetical protein